jgi:predicted DCC family thiol-disulfide oxidoreductase YuxK
MRATPILLFDGKCNVCRHIARWVRKSACSETGEISLIERPVGDDPEELRSLNPGLDIWDAYATVHVVMPDGSMKLGGEAIAEVLRCLPNTRWFAKVFNVPVFGRRPFQAILNLAYIILEDSRPLLGCESCGTPSPWVKSVHWVVGLPNAIFGKHPHPRASPHFTSRTVPRPAHPRPSR